jgi:crotonobetainyl-CoA:carnitine CoA-transferase CaiB-like acyl-CoA transferase
MLDHLRVLVVGSDPAAAVAGRLFADAGATLEVVNGDPDASWWAGDSGRITILSGDRTSREVLAHCLTCEVVLIGGRPADLEAAGLAADQIVPEPPKRVFVYLTPFGLTGPHRDDAATDLTLFCASGLARLLTAPVDDLAEPPTRAAGHQSDVIAGLAAGAAAIHAALRLYRTGMGALIDVSKHEALAGMAIRELAQVGLGASGTPRLRQGDGGGTTVTLLPASDGFVAISPREDHQWRAWLDVMDRPAWRDDPRFASKAERMQHWDSLYPLLCDWSRTRTKLAIADAAQAARVPSFPLNAIDSLLPTPQLRQRRFLRAARIDGRDVLVPGPPYTVKPAAPAHGPHRSEPEPDGARLPLTGYRVLDFSWIIAGPTCTRYLAALGADVIKVEAPDRPDPGRTSELHTVLGEGKAAIGLNLKVPEALPIAEALVRRSDIVIENFATGVLERLGLGYDRMLELNPALVIVSASGLGRTGPEDQPVRVGMAWLDPMCGLLLTFLAAAGLLARARTGVGALLDVSMVEAMLWTMLEPLIQAQVAGEAPTRRGNDGPGIVHGVYPARDEDGWVGVVVPNADLTALQRAEPWLAVDSGASPDPARLKEAIAAWIAERPAPEGEATLRALGIAAASAARASDLLRSPHLRARGFWRTVPEGELPGLPWRWDVHSDPTPAPDLGQDTDAVLERVLGVTADTAQRLRALHAIY